MKRKFQHEAATCKGFLQVQVYGKSYADMISAR